MRYVVFVCAVLTAATVHAAQTMRVDFYHTGNAKEERFSVDRVVVEPLPWPGRTPGAGAELVVDTFFVRPEHRGIGAGEVLLNAAVGWARDSGLRAVTMAAGVHTTAMVERVGFVADARAYRMEL